MTEQTPVPATTTATTNGPPAAPAAPTAPATRPTPQAPQAPNGQPAASGDKQPPWGKPEDFDADKAWELIQNLRTEKGDPALRSELETMRQAQQTQQEAFAKALGIKPEELSDTDKLSQQVNTLQSQILASERRALAAEHKVPETLLTASDAEGMRKQAEELVAFAEAAHVAAATQTPAPAFQPNPGQGQGGASLTPEAQAAAEYETYYPPRPARR